MGRERKGYVPPPGGAGKGQGGGVPSSSPFPLPAEWAADMAVVAVVGQVVRATTYGWRGHRMEGAWVPRARSQRRLDCCYMREKRMTCLMPFLRVY